MMTNTEKMPYILMTANKQAMHAGSWTHAQVKQPVEAPVGQTQLGAGCADQPSSLTGYRATRKQNLPVRLASSGIDRGSTTFTKASELTRRSKVAGEWRRIGAASARRH